jgi:hypothetical protein
MTIATITYTDDRTLPFPLDKITRITPNRLHAWCVIVSVQGDHITPGSAQARPGGQRDTDVVVIS